MYKIIGADQKEYGPISLEQMREWIGEGRLNAQSPVQKEGEGSWKPLSTFAEFADIVPKNIPAPPSVPMSAAPPPPTGSVPNYLVQAILCTICCCIPFGIPAIIFASQVNSKLQAGDYEGALESSRKAKMWCWVAFGIGIVTNLLGAAIQIIATMAEHSH